MKIEPIKQETCADVWNDLIKDLEDWPEYKTHYKALHEYVLRAKAALDREAIVGSPKDDLEHEK